LINLEACQRGWRVANAVIKKLTYATGALDSTFGSRGTYRGSGNCRVYNVYGMQVHNGFLYVGSYYYHRVFRINLTTGACDWSERIYYPTHLSIKNNIMNVFSYYNGNGLTRNLSTNQNIRCNYNYNNAIRYSLGGTLDASGNNFYSYYNRYLYRFTRDSNGCVNLSSYASIIYRSQWQYGYGLASHPTDDSILYGSS